VTVTTNENGAAAKAAPVRSLVEVGATGLRVSGGRVNEEFLPALKGGKAIKVYGEMRDNHHAVAAMLWGIEQELLRVSWSVDGGAMTDVLPDAEREVRTDFLAQCQQDTSQPWSAQISEATTMAQFGWAYLETVYKVRAGPDAEQPSDYDDGRLGWRKMALRGQETLSRWDFDDEGGIRAMRQVLPGGKDVPIPVEIALLFRTTHHKNSPEGRSLLRSAYRAWHYLRRIEEIEAIGIERDLTGIPEFGVPAEYLADDATPSQKSAVTTIERIARNLRADEQAYVIKPIEYARSPEGSPVAGAPLWTFELKATQGRRQHDTSGIINRWTTGLLQSVLADVIMLGHEKIGTQALADVRIEMFTSGLQALADEMRDVFNRFAVPRLFRLNGWGPPFPQFVTTPVQQVDPDSFVERLGKYADAQMKYGPDSTLDEYARTTLGYPTRDETDGVDDPGANPDGG